MIAALLLAIGWWMLFANVFGDNSKLTSSEVLKRVLLSVLLIAGGCGMVWHDVSVALN